MAKKVFNEKPTQKSAEYFKAAKQYCEQVGSNQQEMQDLELLFNILCNVKEANLFIYQLVTKMPKP